MKALQTKYERVRINAAAPSTPRTILKVHLRVVSDYGTGFISSLTALCGREPAPKNAWEVRPHEEGVTCSRCRDRALTPRR
jgi:hypothetical protein